MNDIKKFGWDKFDESIRYALHVLSGLNEETAPEGFEAIPYYNMDTGVVLVEVCALRLRTEPGLRHTLVPIASFGIMSDSLDDILEHTAYHVSVDALAFLHQEIMSDRENAEETLKLGNLMAAHKHDKPFSNRPGL